MTISESLSALNTSVANLQGALSTLLLAAATSGTDASAQIATLTASIEVEIAAVDAIAVAAGLDVTSV